MSELRCYEDLDSFGAETEDALEDLQQDLYHRLVEERGSNIDDRDRGLGIEDLLSGVLDPGLKYLVEHELRKDARVLAVEAILSEGDAAGTYRLDIKVQADEGELGITLESDAAGNVRRVA